MSNFITNSKPHITLKERLNTLMSISEELKFLVGFFYFSGWPAIYEGLKNNKELKIKILVGLQVSKGFGNLIEYAEKQEESLSQDDIIQKYLNSLGFALNNEEMDTKDFREQVEFFLELIENGRLVIRKTEKPNHAKLYLFNLDKDQATKQGKDGEFITGSSNLTRSGLQDQEEFNVEIRDYGYDDAALFFDNLWERAIPITENPDFRIKLIDFIQNRTQIANITPFEAYCLILKTYLDLQNTETEKVDFENLLNKVGLKNFRYQTDAVRNAIQKINEHNGCIIADVVGLGKSVIASMIARQMNKRGIVICPPALIGDPEKRDSGWWEYLEKFGLHNWQVYSRGIVDQIADKIEGKNIEVVIIDEAHYFRNQDTVNYEALWMICRNKKVILLSATPFNNSPADIFSLLKLFVIPGKSTISLEDDLAGRFGHLNYEYKQLSHILKHWNNTEDTEKQKKAERYYTLMIDKTLPIDIKKVKKRTEELSREIKRIIAPVMIRRNRLDLKKDNEYSKEIGELSVIKDPEEVFYYLDERQNKFYDKVIKKYFSANVGFKGAVYQPSSYQKILDNKLDQSENRRYQQQQNLYGFMLGILVKRFESSFASFEESIDRFLKMHRMVKNFIDKTGKLILDRNFIDRIKEYDEEDIEANLKKYAVGDLNRRTPKNTEVYVIATFQRRQEFLDDIDSDIRLLEKVQEELKELKLVEKDPKQEEIILKIKELLKKEPERKIILFSEYVDTIRHLEKRFRSEFGNKLLVCDGKMTRELARNLNSDFNAQYSGSKTNHFKILLTSDKLSEGFNLNRAGVIINYDIPWNPTRVIQRVGRINRIGSKVFDELFILNFFPSLKGASIVKSREIAGQKMFLIHNALGEDTKIFDENEEPTPAALGAKIKGDSQEEGEVNTITKIRNLYAELKNKYPKTIDKISLLPSRTKTAKQHPEYGLNMLRKKGQSLFAMTIGENRKIKEIDFEELLAKTKCTPDEPTLQLSSTFWGLYEEIKKFKPKHNINRSENTLEQKAIETLKYAKKIINDLTEDEKKFIDLMIKDLRDYYTLPTNSIRRIVELSNNEESIRSFRTEIAYLKKHLGQDYFHDIEHRTKDSNTEVIITVENNDLSKLL